MHEARQIRDTVLAQPRTGRHGGPVVEALIFLLLGAVIVLSVVYVAGDADAKAIVSAFVLMVVDLLRSVLHWLLQEIRTFVS